MGGPRSARGLLPHLRVHGLDGAHLQPHHLRLPGPDKHFLINPFGLMYSEVRASNLVKIDLKGQIIGHSDWPVNPAGFTVHSAIHNGVPGAHCVMHYAHDRAWP
jgi:ribulose-5-phosphate 4-epimerase/fuculose-1-phosphate aldolase